MKGKVDTKKVFMKSIVTFAYPKVLGTSVAETDTKCPLSSFFFFLHQGTIALHQIQTIHWTITVGLAQTTQKAILPDTYKKEMSTEYRVAAEPLRGHRNKHCY